MKTEETSMGWPHCKNENGWILKTLLIENMEGKRPTDCPHSENFLYSAPHYLQWKTLHFSYKNNTHTKCTIVTVWQGDVIARGLFCIQTEKTYYKSWWIESEAGVSNFCMNLTIWGWHAVTFLACSLILLSILIPI